MSKKRRTGLKALWLLCLVLGVFVLGGAQGEATVNLLQNGGFEQVSASGNPDGWYTTQYRTQAGYSRLAATDEKARSGRYSAVIENANENDARLTCEVAVEPESLYRFSGYIWVETMQEGGNGANLALEDVYAYTPGEHENTGEWKYMELYGETGPNQRKVELGPRIGGYGAESVGKAYFDDLSLAKVNELPKGVAASLWYREEAPKTPQVTEEGEARKSTGLFVLLAGLFVLLAFGLKGFLGESSPQDALGQRSGKKGLESSGGKTALIIFGLLLFGAFALRVWLAGRVAGYQVDINCFTAWSLRMVSVGPGQFYSPDVFCDYPPGAMLLLWPVGLLLAGVGTSNASATLLILKLIPILCDLAIAIFLFAFARKRMPARAAAFLALLYAFNPASIVNGAAWGQIDSLLALIMLLTAVFAMKKQWLLAIPLFVVGALMKPQALLFAPVAAGLVVAVLMYSKDRGKQLLRMLLGLLIGAACGLCIVLPFAAHQVKPLEWLVGLYSETLSSYGYATLNTANLYYVLGANWKALETALPLLTPLLTGLLLAGLGVWLARLYSGFRFLGQTLCFFRRKEKRQPLAERETRRGLLGLWSLLSGLAFLALTALGATYQNYGVAMMVFVYGWALIGVLTDKTLSALPFFMALALIGVYVLGIKVHERYLFAALPLLLLAFATTRDKRLLALCVGFSATTFVNTAIVLDNCILYGSSQGHLNADTLPVNVALCGLNLLLCLFAAYISVTGPRESRAAKAAEAGAAQTAEATAAAGGDGPKAKQPRKPGDSYRQALLSPRDPRLRLKAKDWLIMGVTSVLYAAFTFSTLGSMAAPQNGWVSTSTEEQIVFQVDSDEPYTLLYFAGVSYNPFSVAVSPDGASWSENYPCNMREGLCYRWQYAIKTDASGQFMDDRPDNRLWLTGRFLRLNADGAGLNLLEVIARNERGETLPLKVLGHTGARDSVLENPKPPQNLLDEQDTLKGEPSWFNGTYFDEIYHARTAYEHLHGQPTYEWTHPPLGKLMMAAGIAIFGMTPFGWRFAGAMVGVWMLPALYLLAKQLLKRRDLATFAMLLFTFDLMHFTQTRIATIDSFPVFFIMLSYLCMARYMMTDSFALGENEAPRLFTRAFWRGLIPLGLSGLFMGLSIASKWIGLYSAVGLALLFLTAVYRQFRVGNIAFDYGTEEEGGLGPAMRGRVLGAQEHALSRIFITCGFCLVFFIAVPLLIYYLSYIPQLSPTGPVTIARIVDTQQSMLKYHATPGLGMDHPFQSPWYQWPFILKPMWFVQDKFEPQGYASTIMCFGNPLVFYVGALCMAAVLLAFLFKYLSFRRGLSLRPGDGNLTLPVMVVGFLAQYLPWVLVPRSMYMYHYFASVPFIILATTWAFSFLPEQRKGLRYGVMWGYVALAAAFFVMFLPYASGMLTPTSWLDAMKWFSKLYY